MYTICIHIQRKTRINDWVRGVDMKISKLLVKNTPLIPESSLKSYRHFDDNDGTLKKISFKRRYSRNQP